MTTSHTLASVLIRAHVESTQAELDATAAQARAAHYAAVRSALLDLPADAPAAVRAVAEVLADTVHIGRQNDGFPEVTWPDDTRALVIRLVRAGLLTTTGGAYPEVTIGAYALSESGESRDKYTGDADYQAWAQARDYRARNA